MYKHHDDNVIVNYTNYNTYVYCHLTLIFFERFWLVAVLLSFEKDYFNYQI